MESGSHGEARNVSLRDRLTLSKWASMASVMESIESKM